MGGTLTCDTTWCGCVALLLLESIGDAAGGGAVVATPVTATATANG
jgi:hypothetical protein